MWAFARCSPTTVPRKITWPKFATAGPNRRWPAAYELSRLMADPKVRADRTLAPALVRAFQESKGDQQVRRYLALAIGRLDPPMPADAVADLTHALDDPDGETRISVIWALGSSGDPRWSRSCCRSTRRLPTPAFARWSSTRSALFRATRKSTR